MTSFSWSKLTAVAALGLLAALAVAPTGLGFSGGICKGCAGGASAPAGDFDKVGCVACHGTVGKFKPVDNSGITYSIQDSKGGFLNGPYDPKETYTIAIRLRETVAPDGGATGHHAGFNLRATGGKLAGVGDLSQAGADGAQATHKDATHTAWNVTWTPPAAGAVGFQLFVNDVDGDGSPSADDTPHELFFGVTDSTGAALGAAAVAAEPEYGISLQQYWIGLIGLAGMIFIMVAGYLFLKFGNRHNTDAKDR
ncbi:MAG: hypothetical protein QOI63_1175 [Thermoplasmata archaeon]|nr:hypothetical protein [Thermoplasmata archaeon]